VEISGRTEGNEERKEGTKTSGKDVRRPSPFAATGQDRWSTIEGPRRQDPSFNLHTRPPARARIKTRAACRLPVPRTPDAAGALSSLRGSLGSFYERSLWKRASCARDKPAVPTYGVCTRKRTEYMHTHTCKCVHSKPVRHAHQRKAHKRVRTHRRYMRVWKVSRVDTRITRARIKLHHATTKEHRIAYACARAVSLGWSHRAKNFRLRSHENVD